MKAGVPVLETERLRMRGHRTDDLDACLAMWNDPIVTRYLGSHPCNVEVAWSKIMRYVGHWALLDFGYWVVEERSSGRFVGEVGFADFKRDLVPALDAPEIGWVLSSWAHGAGFATEAVRAALDWAAGHFGPAPTVALIDPDNVASIRVAEKVGYREHARLDYKAVPTVLFRRAGS